MGAELTFPMARRLLSKNKMMPRNEKNTPNPVSPSPISVSYVESLNQNRKKTE